MKIESYKTNGSSLPIVIKHNDQKYFVKLHAGMSGSQALINEWIGNSLGLALGINVQTPRWIEISEDIKTDHLSIELRELIKKSIGLNIAFEFKENVKEIDVTELKGMLKKDLIEVFLFDLLLINIDRSSSNLNLMKVDKSIISFDYESSLFIQQLSQNKELLENPKVLQCLRENPLFQIPSEAKLYEFIQKLKKVNIEKILDGIPLVLLSQKDKHLLFEGIKARKKEEWSIYELLQKLRKLEPETKHAFKKRINKNQDQFKRNLKNGKPN